ncbi:MAG: VWA domain-containing protein [Thermoanaerobaculia bacterium]
MRAIRHRSRLFLSLTLMLSSGLAALAIASPEPAKPPAANAPAPATSVPPVASAPAIAPASMSAVAASATAAAPAVVLVSPEVLQKEAVREFLDEGPGLLLGPVERARIAALPAAEAAAAANAFFARDPLPETAGNELVQGVAQRRLLLQSEGLSLRDARGQVLFLQGEPREKLKVECGDTFRPLEIWSYGTIEAPRDAVIYRERADGFYVLWHPTDSKRNLYVPEMEYYLEQWEELRGRISGKRPDRVLCKSSEAIDKITGVSGLFGFQKDRMTDAQADAFTAPPADLGAWAREAAGTKIEKLAERLPVESVAVTFPERRDQRLLARLRIVLPAGAGLAVAGEAGSRESRLTVAGRIELAGAPFEEFRNRFVLPPPAETTPVVLVTERLLRPGGPYVLALEVRDEVSGKTAWLSQGFTVPAQPLAEPETKIAGAQEVIGEETGLTKVGAKDALLLLPPLSDVVFGLWRAEAIVAGDRVHKVAFYVNGQRQLVRTSAPWTAELRLPNLPTELVVRAEGMDDKDAVVVADEVVLNEPQGEAKVRLLQPPRGKRVVGASVARAAIVVPEGKRIESVEFRLNDTVIATLTQPPWETPFVAPSTNDPVYLTVAATYVDGTRVEDFRVLSGDAFLEQVDVDLVEIFATVYDKTGRLAENLTEGDFEILDRGKKQTIAKFELVKDLPLSVGLVLDTSGSMRESIGEAKRAASEFLSAVVRPTDRCFAVGFADRPQLLMPLTPDVQAVQIAFRDLPAVGNTALHDAMVFALYQLRGIRGRKAIVLLSDGDDTSSLVSYDDALEFSRRSGAAIYTIGLNVGGAQLSIRGKLEKLASETGGRSFFVSKAEELSSVYSEISRELRSQYLLAFAPNPPGKEGVFSTVEVKAQGGKLKTRAPRGYYP